MQAHYLHLSGRDDALSRSLNSDYLAQLYISPDTKRMDRELIQDVARDAELPDEAKTMLVFKRGCSHVPAAPLSFQDMRHVVMLFCCYAQPESPLNAPSWPKLGCLPLVLCLHRAPQGNLSWSARLQDAFTPLMEAAHTSWCHS